MTVKILMKKLRPLLGVAAVVIMSVSFSGFSVKVDILSEIVCRMFCLNNVLLSEEAEEISLIDRTCTYLYNSFSPLNETLCEAAYRFSEGVSVGDISQRVGDVDYMLSAHVIDENDEVDGDIDMVYGDGYHEPDSLPDAVDWPSQETISQGVTDNSAILNRLLDNPDTDYLIKNLYVVDSTTSIRKSDFDVKKLLEKDTSLKNAPDTNFVVEPADTKKPQILIYHTHAASESFKGSKAGVIEEGIVGVGDRLAAVLAETYGYGVYHDRTEYDSIDGKIDRSLAYAKALPSVKGLLEEYPSIEVVIDLHRDGVGANVHTITSINGKQTAKIMLFNGLCRGPKGPKKYLKNDYLTDNLAFSLRMKLTAMELYPDFTKPIFLKGYRYNMHLCPKSLLVELGSQNNTFEEACNAVEPFAHILNTVLVQNPK